MEPRPSDPTDAGGEQLRAIAIDPKKVAHRLDRFRKHDRDPLELQQASIHMTSSRMWIRQDSNKGRFDS